MESLLEPERWALAENIVTVLAVIVGGVWSYLLFVRRRQRYPRANVTHTIESWFEGTSLFVRARVHVENIGDVRICLKEGVVYLSRVTPWPRRLQPELAEGRTEISFSERTLNWALLAKSSWKDGDDEVEPHETETLVLDFVVNEPVERVELRSHLKNLTKRRRWLFLTKDIRWNTHSFHEIKMEDHERPAAPRPDHVRQGTPAAEPLPDTQGPALPAPEPDVPPAGGEGADNGGGDGGGEGGGDEEG